MTAFHNRSLSALRVLARPGLGGKKGNPYTYLLYANMPCHVDDFSPRRALFERYDVLHLHWPEADLNGSENAAKAYISLRKRFFAIDYMRARGTKVFWTVHNLHSHEQRYPRLERWFWPRFLRRVDGYIALTEGGTKQAVRQFPALAGVPAFVVPHGHYRAEYPDVPEVEARKALAIPRQDRVILFFGNIRPYKNVPHLIDVFRQTGLRDARLYIVGKAGDAALAGEIAGRAAGDSRIRIESGFVTPERAAQYFKAADLVVLPYRDILNSGAALLALSFNRPILAPNRGAMGELAADIGSEWVRTFDELDAAEFCSAIEWAVRFPRTSAAPLDHLDWGQLGARTLEAYSRVLARRAA
jgi:beta-1,4-mannosyltransferase